MASIGNAEFSHIVEQTTWLAHSVFDGTGLERPVSHENCPSAARSRPAGFRWSLAGLPDNSSLHDVNAGPRPAKIRKQKPATGRPAIWILFSDSHVFWFRGRGCLVEPDGIEPTTSCLQSRRSPN